MILVGQYDSPYVRRVAVSLRVLGIAYEHDTRSVFSDFDSMRRTNPLGRIPSLVRDDGEVLIDSAAILDWLDETVGPQRALLPRSGQARVQALKRIALASGGIDKLGAANYERLLRPEPLRWPDWIVRCVAQATGALEALETEVWDDRIDQGQITTGCLFGYIELTAPEVMPAGRFPALERLWARLRGRPEFVATRTEAYALPAGRLDRQIPE
ncbi:MAG: glutathione S-transferase N-terminal domain-containing protein [Alphaproteobacteria bacterium]|nr:glutathione S-transferase N-terminal domain-containing protein [Alphaproteobacteria bacterium]